MTFVGAGSIEFTRNVVTDLCGYPELARRIAAQTGCGAEETATAGFHQVR